MLILVRASSFRLVEASVLISDRRIVWLGSQQTHCPAEGLEPSLSVTPSRPMTLS